MTTTALLRFHAALSVDAPTGLIPSFITRTSRLPWLDADVAYEDWYLIHDSAALDPLDAARREVRTQPEAFRIPRLTLLRERGL